MMMNERTLELFTVIAGDGFTGRVALDATRWAIPDDPPQRRAIVVLRPEHAEAPFLPNIVVEVRPVVGVIAALCGCSEDISGQVTKAWSVDQIAAFPDSIAIDGPVMYISASANRDFMPIAPSDGRPLSAGVQLLGLTNGPIEWTPKDPVLYVILGDRMWISSARSQQAWYAASLLWEFSASDGPKWGPGAVVDIVLEFGVAPGNRCRIIDRQVEISRSE